MRPAATPLRRAGRDAVAAAIGFWVIISAVFLAGRWLLSSQLPGVLLDRAAAATTPAPGEEPSDPLALLRTQLAAALAEPPEGQFAPAWSGAAAVRIAGAVEAHAVLDSVEPLGDPCLGCLQQIAGAARETRLGDPVQIRVRYWEGSIALSITASAAIDTPQTELQVSLNAGGKVFFGRDCSLVMEHSVQDVYVTAVEGESVELFDVRSFTGRLECAVLDNSTTGEAVSLLAVFSYSLEDAAG